MVNHSLPLPILKYVELTPTELNSIIAEYPFYLFPRVARILKINKNEGESVDNLNFFGFESTKINQYAQIYKSPDYKANNSSSEIPNSHNENLQDDNLLSLDDIIVQIHESNPKTTTTNSQFFPESNEELILEEEISQSEEKIEILNIENEAVKAEEPSLFELIAQIHAQKEVKIDLNNSETDTDEFNKLPPNNDNLSSNTILETEKTKTDIIENETQKGPEIIELSQNNDIEYLEINSIIVDPVLIHNEDETIQFIDTKETKLEQEAEVKAPIEIINQNETSSEIKQEDELQYVYIDKIIEFGNMDISSQVDEIKGSTKTPIIEFEASENVVEFESTEAPQPKTELPIVEETQQIEETKTIEMPTIEDEKSTPVDFNTWLNNFNQQSKPNLNIDKNQVKLIKPVDVLEQNLAISHIEHTLIEEIEPKNDLESKINLAKDEELEGVLKDSFYLSQIETKKESKKISASSKIIDNSLQSLISIDIISETIAILYAQQGHIARAIEVYEKLIEKFPEKSGFFATQIENLKTNK